MRGRMRMPRSSSAPRTGFAIAPRIVVFDRPLRYRLQPDYQHRAGRIELDVDPLADVAEIDGGAPDDLELRVRLEETTLFIRTSRRAGERDGAVDAEGEAVRLRQPAPVHGGEIVTDRHRVLSRRAQGRCRREPQCDRIAPLPPAPHRGRDGEDAVRIDAGVERAGHGPVERDGDDGGRRRSIGGCDSKDTQRCRGGHDETADGERNDGGERAHKAFWWGS